MSIIDELILDFSERILETFELEQIIKHIRPLSDRAKIRFWMNILSENNTTKFTIVNEKQVNKLLFEQLVA